MAQQLLRNRLAAASADSCWQSAGLLHCNRSLSSHNYSSRRCHLTCWDHPQVSAVAGAPCVLQRRFCSNSSSSSISTKHIPSPPWSLEFQVDDMNCWRISYALPEKIDNPRKAIEHFFDPIFEELQAGPTDALTGSKQAYVNSILAQYFLDEVKRKALHLVAEDMVMEAMLVLTRQYALLRSETQANQKVLMLPFVQLAASRSLRDRTPALVAVLAGLLGPLAWLPAVLVLNEVLMRRVEQYSALPQGDLATSPFARMLGWASFKHHIQRPLMDVPLTIVLKDNFRIEGIDDLTEDELKEIATSGKHREHVSQIGEIDL